MAYPERQDAPRFDGGVENGDSSRFGRFSAIPVRGACGAGAIFAATSFPGKATIVPHLGTAHLTAVVMPKHPRRDQMPAGTTGATGPFLGQKRPKLTLEEVWRRYLKVILVVPDAYTEGS